MAVQTTDSTDDSVTYLFKYDTDEESIELDTLINSQLEFKKVLAEIQKRVAPDTRMSIRLKPLPKGSVPFDTMLTLSWLNNLFTIEHAKFAYTIVKQFVEVIKIKNFLKGKDEAKREIKEGNTTIYNNQGENITVNNITLNFYNSSQVADVALSRAFNVINRDLSVSGIEIQDEKKYKLLSVKRNEFKNLSEQKSKDEILHRISSKSVKTEHLTIFKVVFEPGYKWQFVTKQGRKISANLPDEFMKSVEEGEKFSKGDTLIVRMEVTKEIDKSLGVQVEKGFVITEVAKHIPKKVLKQTNLLTDKSKSRSKK
jgi:hypothetical protein